MEIIVYGAGSVGQHLTERLNNYYAHSTRISAILDKNKTVTLNGDTVTDIKECDKRLPIVIAIGSRKKAMEAFLFLEFNGFKDVYLYIRKDNPPYGELADFLGNECIKIDNYDCDLIPHVELHAIDSCNLNCRGCAHFSPLYNSDEFDFGERIRDIEMLSQLSTNILSFFILGGEPFLNPQLKEYIIAARKSFQKSDIEIVTNGTLLLACDEDILNAARDNRVVLAISIYEATNKILDKILLRLQKSNVEYILKSYDIKNIFNKPLVLDNNTSLKKYCMSDGCVNIADGRIARCPTLMYVSALNRRFGTKFPNKGIYLISDFKDAESLNRAMSEQVELCDYCVESKILWSRCDNEIQLSDFVSF
ncbi:radical SAM protein [Butyrivibrio sp. LC3010]|uniref:radical SAM protein n=1 Tax=Butyrivibrio sp. LC3010 TaxID=1280680 RepID=UPI00042632C5|nr:radical SAM protein [Butyrivibrio sp. LC3010]